MSRPVVYACVTQGYDRVAEVDTRWDCDFLLFHDGSVQVPEGWQGRRLEVPGTAGADLNRYAKMLPHRLGLGTGRSMYIDGNIRLLRDPRTKIDAITAEHRLAAFAHPTRDCAYSELRENLRLGFVGPGPVWRQWRAFRADGVPRHGGLFEAGLMLRQHDDPGVMAFGETWWELWKGGLGRDQPLMAAALWRQSMPIHVMGHDLRSDPDGLIAIVPHATRRTRLQRIPRRFASELALFRAWLS